jgi:hypothetical protein
MTINEIENILRAEGLGAYDMERRSMTEGQTARMGEDGEYDIADYMESDNSPEATMLVAEMLEQLSDVELAGMEHDDEPAEEEPAADKPWGFLFK